MSEETMGVVADESPTLGKLAEALAKAQGAMRAAPKDSKNPFYNSKYADLASVMAVVREPLAANGLAITQRLSTGQGGVVITTMLMHASGEWMRDRLFVLVEPTVNRDGKKQAWIQAFGSAVTYARRYALSSMLGVAADEDDDGNAAAEYSKPAQQPRASAPAPRVATPPVTVAENLVGKIRYGKRKGVPFADLSDSDLEKSAAKVAESQDPDDVAMRKDIAIEMARRKVISNGGASHGQAVTQ